MSRSTSSAAVSVVHDAMGIWFTELPTTSEKIIKTLQGGNDLKKEKKDARQVV